MWILCLAEDSLETSSFISLKDKNKKLKCCLLQFLFGALRVNTIESLTFYSHQYSITYVQILICVYLSNNR